MTIMSCVEAAHRLLNEMHECGRVTEGWQWGLMRHFFSCSLQGCGHRRCSFICWAVRWEDEWVDGRMGGGRDGE